MPPRPDFARVIADWEKGDGQVAVLPSSAFGSRDQGKGQSAGPPGFGPEPMLVHEPGGTLVSDLVHPGFQTVEQLYRTLPEQGWFDPSVSPSKIVQFQLGSYQVPKGQAYWLTDYSFQINRFSGLDPGDTVPMEEGRLSAVLGFDINVNGRRMANLLYQLDPVAVQTQLAQFAPPPTRRANNQQFDTAAAQSFAAGTGIGTSLLPVRRQRFGPAQGPFTIIAGEGVQVSLNVVIFRPVPTPIAFIEGRHAGFGMAVNSAASIINRVRPR